LANCSLPCGPRGRSRQALRTHSISRRPAERSTSVLHTDGTLGLRGGVNLIRYSDLWKCKSGARGGGGVKLFECEPMGGRKRGEADRSTNVLQTGWTLVLGGGVTLDENSNPCNTNTYYRQRTHKCML
jgi:hypothetical protein